MDTITNPHDKLFRETWSDREVAQDFLRRYLPPQVVALLDFSALEIVKDSFVDVISRRTRLVARYALCRDVRCAGYVAAYLPNFEYLVQDLTRYSDEELTGTVVSRVVMLLFKHIHDPDIFQKLPAIFALMQELLRQERGLHTIEMLLRYVFNALEDITVTQLVTIAEQSLQGEMVMTLAEQLRQEGWRNGVSQGIQQGARFA